MGRRKQGTIDKRQPPAGKLEPEDRTLAQRAILEAAQEFEIAVSDLRLAAVVQTRCSRGNPRMIIALHAHFDGMPVETEEMADPVLYPVDAPPLDEMHEDAMHWFVDVLQHAPDAPPLSLEIVFCPAGRPIGRRHVPPPELPRPVY